MKEELFISGRNIPNIDPFLNIWHWEIPVYLFLGGLSAGIMFFAGLFTVIGKEKEMATTVKYAPFLVPIALVLGLIALFLDLKHQLYFWRLYTTIRIESPMSWGAWTLMLVTPLSVIWAAVHIKDIIPGWKWKFEIAEQLESFVKQNIKVLAWANMGLAIILGVYTGILLSAFNARPLWNTSILGPLFLVSGLSTGLAAIIWMSKSHYERTILSKIDIALIGVELFLIIHLFMGFLAGSAVKIEAAELFLGGPFTTSFWGFVVILGLIIPAILEILELRGYKVPIWIPSLLVLLGGLLFRFIMVEAGQITRFLY